ncbi:MAG: phage major capsid protein [Ruminococcus sp.]|nr:phage major capsid protein [Ruminococcus sp.]
MKKLIEKRAALKALLESMLASIKQEERAFTEEEAKKFDETEAEIKSIDATIAAEERAKGITDVVVPETEPKPASDEDKTAELEERAFAAYIFDKAAELRAGGENMTMSSNGAVVPESIAGRIIQAVKDICPILQGADVYHEKGTLKIPKWTKSGENSDHDITIAYSEEFKELEADSGKFTSVDLGGYLVGALTLIGKSVENNTHINVVDFVIKKMAEKIAEFMEKEFLTGTEKCQGAVNTSNKVEAEDSETISFSDLVRLQSAVKQVFQKNACWTMHPDTFTTIKFLEDGDGRPLLNPDVTKEFPYTILGKPVYLSDNMPKIAAGAKSILYGDYSGLSVNIREDISIQVLKEKYATQHAIGVISWLEIDSKVSDEQKLAVLAQRSA